MTGPAPTPAVLRDPEPDSLAGRVLEAYGGPALWSGAAQVHARLSAGGLLFTWKRGRAGRFRDLSVHADVHEQRIRFVGFHDGLDGVLVGHRVQLETPDGEVVARRDNARDRFPYRGRLVRWDPLDMMYFLGYALWNYFVFPALLLREDVEWVGEGPDLLRATFPAHLATHCPVQRFRVDPETLLVSRHQYTAEVFGRRWARACHLTSEYRVSSGVPYASRRRVMPRSPGSGGPMAAPVLIWADLHDYRLQ